MNGKILHWVPDVYMGNAHEGLAAIAKKELKVNVSELKPGEFILFMNTRWTGFKVYCANHILLHYRSPDHRRLNAKAVLALPHFIKGQHINYDKALASTIRDEYGSRYSNAKDAEQAQD